MTATPWGFRDILPEEAQAREEIALTVKGCFREHHYLPVETPLLEDKGSLEEGGRIADTPFKLFDDDGRLPEVALLIVGGYGEVHGIEKRLRLVLNTLEALG
mgnify:CR=1 FL=1